MGKMKDYLIGLEDDYFAMATEIVNECEDFSELVQRMNKYRDWMSLHDDENVYTVLGDIWSEYWGDYYDSSR